LTIDILQSEIEDHEIGALGRALGYALLATHCLDHLVAICVQADPQKLLDLPFVVDHEDAGDRVRAHRRAPPPLGSRRLR
jgi:hypothetical protein